MRVNLLVGGPVGLVPQEVVRVRQAETWIAVDHGASLLLKWGITPAVAIGDFDSTSQAEFARLRQHLAEIETFPPAKDFTDTQLGVKLAIDRFQPTQIDIFGATGGRLDHPPAYPFSAAWLTCTCLSRMIFGTISTGSGSWTGATQSATTSRVPIRLLRKPIRTTWPLSTSRRSRA